MNSGFISSINDEVQYFNKTLLNFVKKMNYNDVNNNETNVCDNIQVNELFNNIFFDNEKINAFEKIAKILNKKHDEVGDNFIFLGTKDIEIKPSSFLNLEVSGRYNELNSRYEFVFNDVTRSKQIEQKNAEFKYKTLFLSKIAHEFKNPLLCISELVEQVTDNLSKRDMQVEKNISEILKRIKSMSYYLIILVKDMDFFSQKNSGTIQKKIEFDKIALNDIINFCSDIVDALIQKSHKQTNINFNIIKGKSLPMFITIDEIKLKQILINLLSNAVKYTLSGSIHLKINFKDKQLKFQVDDTGKGISDTQRDKLFTPFSNEFDKLNKFSSGLGGFLLQRS
jgi:signal transduction histidine kinase